jgi:hypothetical protein
MTTKRLARSTQRQQRVDAASPPASQAAPGPGADPATRGTDLRICCHGETVAPAQRQFQFRNLTDDPRLNLRLAGILISAQGTG